ncbi:MAG: tetratricopeptide repeat protein [Bacteriovoracia bacterium]
MEGPVFTPKGVSVERTETSVPDASDPADLRMLAEYLAKQKILVADPLSVSRVGIAKALVGMGAQTKLITTVDSFEWAMTTIKKDRPTVVVSDYNMGTRCGLELFETEVSEFVSQPDRLTVIVTKNTSQAAVAKAAEGDVDVYVTKPYSLDSFQKLMIEAVKHKVHPTPYVKAITEGRAYLASSDFERAASVFERAIQYDEKPALACYYLGHAHELNRALEQAQASYNRGLTYNRIHYKCLLGLHDALMKQNKFPEAYNVLKRIIRDFPINPSRFNTALKLAVRTADFADMEDFYDLYVQMDDKSEELVKHICAALIVAGKVSLQQGKTDRAFSLFRRAGVTAAGKTAYLKQIISILCEYGHGDEADKFLSRFPKDVRETVEFLAIDYLVISKVKTIGQIIEHGRKLLKGGHHDPLIYRILAEASTQAGHGETAEMLRAEARRRWQDAFV